MSNILAAAAEMMEAKEAKAKAVTIEQILKKIKEHTFSCVVAGGYCRDVFHGVAHKDIDICLYNFFPHDDAECSLMNQLFMWMKSNVDMMDVTQHDKSYRGDDRVGFVWHLPHHNVDIICYNNCRSYVDVIRKFDCNLNQFFLPSTVPNFDEAIPYNPSLEESPVYLGDDCPDFLVFLKDLPEERIEKMIAKHKAFYPDAWGGLQEPVAYY
ncbi:putative nucleotidyltransferase [Ralstonia phage Reminis]|uniref:Putative nucleotidyltransferase n=1 Tax=Ralstonia phage Reminis TaxID=2662139 RepID=A0A5Q2U7D3_9CAUD|nr:putative nucleotidyltransferase [Ralstonia phage Reminis]